MPSWVSNLMCLNVEAFVDDYKSNNNNYNSLPYVPNSVPNRYIPLFITEMLRIHNRPILYLHCDSVIVRRPPEERFHCIDVGYSIGHGNAKTQRILSNPIFFRPSRTARDFLEIWSKMCLRIDTSRSEHLMLEATIHAFASQDRIKPFAHQMSSRNRKQDPDIFF